MTSSPKYKNLGIRPKQSPIELKEKLRKNFKSKIQNCRGMLIDKLRGSLDEKDLSNTISDVYKNIFNGSYKSNDDDDDDDDDEYEVMDELKNELIQEELEWYLKEYEKYQMGANDLPTDDDDNVICLVCQKTNYHIDGNNLHCSYCKSAIKTTKTLPEIKRSILSAVESHNSLCNSDVQFGLVPDANESHVYLICDTCVDMKLII